MEINRENENINKINIFESKPEEIELQKLSENQNNINEVSQSGTFLISVRTLEELMGAYKERGSEFRDLKQISQLGGVNEILKKLKTSSKNGISSIED